MSCRSDNQALGHEFEREFCAELARHGYWVHFLTPDARGAQPFDVIAVKDGRAYAIDCKTCVRQSFSLTRLEDNQVLAFERWLKCGNGDPKIAVKHRGKIYIVGYSYLKREWFCNLNADVAWKGEL